MKGRCTLWPAWRRTVTSTPSTSPSKSRAVGSSSGCTAPKYEGLLQEGRSCHRAVPRTRTETSPWSSKGTGPVLQGEVHLRCRKGPRERPDTQASLHLVPQPMHQVCVRAGQEGPRYLRDRRAVLPPCLSNTKTRLTA